MGSPRCLTRGRADGEFIVWALRSIAINANNGVLDSATTENMQNLVMQMRSSLTGLYDYQFQVMPFCCMRLRDPKPSTAHTHPESAIDGAAPRSRSGVRVSPLADVHLVALLTNLYLVLIGVAKGRLYGCARPLTCPTLPRPRWHHSCTHQQRPFVVSSVSAGLHRIRIGRAAAYFRRSESRYSHSRASPSSRSAAACKTRWVRISRTCPCITSSIAHARPRSKSSGCAAAALTRSGPNVHTAASCHCWRRRCWSSTHYGVA
jgi:hypothetical protein